MEISYYFDFMRALHNLVTLLWLFFRQEVAILRKGAEVLFIVVELIEHTMGAYRDPSRQSYPEGRI